MQAEAGGDANKGADEEKKEAEQPVLAASAPAPATAVAEWTEAQVWQWLSKQSYGGDLDKGKWKYVNGVTVCSLTEDWTKNQGNDLNVPAALRPRLLADLKLLIKTRT